MRGAPVTHLLVTNDFPPKVGGIQSYLYELWRRLPPDRFAVLTIAHPDAPAFDRRQPYRIERLDHRMLLPTPTVRRAVCDLADQIGADAVVLDPALPVGWLGPSLDRPYGVVLHGAEVTVPGRLPGARQALRRVLQGASLVIAAGEYPLREARRAAGAALPGFAVVPPGVDCARFTPLDPAARRAVRERFDLPQSGTLVVSMSRLVPRKGFDVLIEAAAVLRGEGRDLTVAICGGGRDRERLVRLAASHAVPVRFLGRVSDDDLPGIIGCADVFAMLCRTRWLGLEQEGFGIVFLEAAAAGVPVVAGRSGGVGDAVVDDVTGLVVDRPGDVVPATDALRRLLDDAPLRDRLTAAGRARAETEFEYDTLAARLDEALARLEGGAPGAPSA
jgi:phosphatidylinositol alpha-1,6-mannosyltransferase